MKSQELYTGPQLSYVASAVKVALQQQALKKKEGSNSIWEKAKSAIGIK